MHFPVVAKFLLFLAVIFGGALNNTDCLSFTYESFSTDQITDFLLSDSSIVLDAIQVTPDVSSVSSIANLRGRALYRTVFKLWGKPRGKSRIRASFNSTFVLNISPITTPGGEGLAFILSANSAPPENSDGQWLGIVNAISNGSSLAKIVAVEFDTRKSYSEDIDDNHVGLDVNSVYSVKQVSLSNHNVTLSSSRDVTVNVQYDGKNISVFMGPDMKNPVISEPIDLSALLPQEVYVGFSASTSNFTEKNCIRSWEFHGTEIHDSELWWLWVVVPVVGVALLVVAGVAFFLYWRGKLEKERLEDAFPSIEEEINGNSMAPRKFQLKVLRKATNTFNPGNKLGKGGFGTVYKGILGNREVAVKRISKKSNQGKQEFMAEITTIGNLHHRNLVKLIGWCYENRELLLVYEYLPNGSLDKFLFCNEKRVMEESTLDWGTRISVINGVAQALDYLHNGCEKRVLHRDIKASNIMLDSEFNARLGDFGLARTIQQQGKTHHSTNEIAGTPGYMAPEIFLTGRATVETDVYGFGVLLLEVACGRKPGNPGDHNDYNNSIVYWLWELYKIGNILDGTDPRLKGDFEGKEMECVLILGLACCHPNPHKRPSMKIVLHVLTGEAPPPAVPTERPAFVWPAMPPSFNQLDYSLAGDQFTPFSELTGR